MTITPIAHSGNSAKFHVVTKNGEFDLAFSYTLKTNIWKLADAAAEQDAAEELAEAIVSRHNPKFPFKKIYIFGEHNTGDSLEQVVKLIRKNGL